MGGLKERNWGGIIVALWDKGLVARRFSYVRVCALVGKIWVSWWMLVGCWAWA